MNPGRVYRSKLLLFGEHAIVKGGDGLAIPYDAYGAKWEQTAGHKDESLFRFGQYLEQLDQASLVWKHVRIADLLKALENGLWLRSDIPQGAGLGSSGALCAALLDRYGKNLPEGQTPEELILLKRLFAELESYFHGASSGVDPLISYLDCPLFLGANGLVRKVSLPEKWEAPLPVFLFNTKLPRKTGPLVKAFLRRCEDDRYREEVQKILFSANSDAITAILEGNQSSLRNAFRRISAWQRQNMEPMIPKMLRAWWDEGLESDAVFWKVFGAGGGGYMMGWADDPNALPKGMDQNDLLWVFG